MVGTDRWESKRQREGLLVPEEGAARRASAAMHAHGFFYASGSRLAKFTSCHSELVRLGWTWPWMRDPRQAEAELEHQHKHI